MGMKMEPGARFEKTKISFELYTCDSKDGTHFGPSQGCPYHDTDRTPGAGFAHDLFCCHPSVGREKVNGYIEYSADLLPVPNWCPLKEK